MIIRTLLTDSGLCFLILPHPQEARLKQECSVSVTPASPPLPATALSTCLREWTKQWVEIWRWLVVFFQN